MFGYFGYFAIGRSSWRCSREQGVRGREFLAAGDDTRPENFRLGPPVEKIALEHFSAVSQR